MLFHHCYFSSVKLHTSWNYTKCMYVHYAPLSVSNLQEKLASLHACGCRQLFNSLYLKKKKKKQGGPEGESFEGFAPQHALTHFCMALAFFHLFFGLSFSGILKSSLCSFFDLLQLLLFSSLNCFLQSSLSFLHTAPAQRSELVRELALDPIKKMFIIKQNSNQGSQCYTNSNFNK